MSQTCTTADQERPVPNFVLTVELVKIAGYLDTSSWGGTYLTIAVRLAPRHDDCVPIAGIVLATGAIWQVPIAPCGLSFPR